MILDRATETRSDIKKSFAVLPEKFNQSIFRYKIIHISPYFCAAFLSITNLRQAARRHKLYLLVLKKSPVERNDLSGQIGWAVCKLPGSFGYLFRACQAPRGDLFF